MEDSPHWKVRTSGGLYDWPLDSSAVRQGMLADFRRLCMIGFMNEKDYNGWVITCFA